MQEDSPWLLTPRAASGCSTSSSRSCSSPPFIEVGLLIRQNRSLRAQLESRMQEAGRAAPTSVPRPPAWRFTDPQGTREPDPVRGEAGPTLVLVASAECPACAETLRLWKRSILGRRRPRGSSGSWRSPKKIRGPDGELQEGRPRPARSTRSAASRPWARGRWSFVPLTVLVDAAGVVRKSWTEPCLARGRRCPISLRKVPKL